MLLERGQGGIAGGEAVHRHEREPGIEAGPQAEHLADNHVQEGEPLLDLEQRLGGVQAHAGPEAAVELEHHGAVERLAGAGLVLRQLLGVRQVLHRLEAGLGQRAHVALAQLLVVAAEGLDRGVGYALRAHLLDAGGEAVHPATRALDPGSRRR